MLVFVVEPDRARADAIRRALARRGASAAFAHDFASAEALLTGPARPAALYVADFVPPLSGADLLSALERNARMAGVPLVAAVRDEGSLLAAALRRGGVRVVTDAFGADGVAALLASLAAACDEADWRASVIAWSRYLAHRTERNRARVSAQRARLAETPRRGHALAVDTAALLRGGPTRRRSR